MNRLSIALSALALIGVVYLLATRNPAARSESGKPAVASGNASRSRIAYVDIDSLEARYDYLKTQKEGFLKKQQQLEGELRRSAEQLQRDAGAFQQKAQAGSITQSEAEATQKRLIQQQQTLEGRKQTITEQLLKDQEAFNTRLHGILDSVLLQYNKDKRYDYILRYSKEPAASSVMYAEKSLNITDDVVKAMNASSPKP